MNALRLAILAFPSDHLFGGGLTLLSRLAPEVRRSGGAMAWVDRFYEDDEPRLQRWTAEGLTLIRVGRPRRWYRRWRQPEDPAVADLRAFNPNVVIVGTGADRRYPNDEWRLKRQMTDAARSAGVRVVMMHQLSEPGHWVEPGPEAAAWLEWQRSAHVHHFVSERTWRETEVNFGLALPGKVVRNPYNVPFNSPPPWPQDRTLSMAFVGRFRIQQKGLDLLLEAAAQPQLATEPDWRLTLIGGGAFMPQIESEIRRRGLAERISVRDHTADIAGIWREHQVLVMPSRSEGLSLALTEAMLCERPAIATLAGGTGELLVDGVTGFRVHLDAEDIARGMHRALAMHHAGSLSAMGAAAGRRARSVFPAEPEREYVNTLCALANGSPS